MAKGKEIKWQDKICWATKSPEARKPDKVAVIEARAAKNIAAKAAPERDASRPANPGGNSLSEYNL